MPQKIKQVINSTAQHFTDPHTHQITDLSLTDCLQPRSVHWGTGRDIGCHSQRPRVTDGTAKMITR